MIATPGEPDLPILVPESFHEQTDKELTENDIKRMEADDQAIQTILLGLPEDVYAAVDSCETAKEIWECDEVTELRVERLAKSHDSLALMAHSQNSYNFPITHKDQSSSGTHPQQSFLINNKYNPQPSLNQNFIQPPVTSLEGINDPTKAINAALILFAKAFQLTAPTNNNQRTSSNPHNHQIAQLNAIQNAGVHNGRNQNGLVVVPRIANQNGTGNVVAARAEGIQLQAEEFDFMAATHDLDEIEEVNANCILMVNFSMHPHLEKQYTDLLEPIPEPQLVPQNDNHVTSVASSMVQSGGTIETSFAPNEETHAHQETVYCNLVDQVALVNMVNCNIRATNAELKYELARYKIQKQRIEISQEKYDKLEKCCQKSVYQE
nr:hypothetical protein [Tanacetum cinerariifolium]